MKTILYYLPSLLTIIVIFMLDESMTKWLLLAVLVLSVVIAKYKRSKADTEEVEYDERVNTNIRYWSFGFLMIMNTFLIIYLILVSQSFISEWLTTEYMIIYLTATLLIALYVVPSIAKRF